MFSEHVQQVKRGRCPRTAPARPSAILGPMQPGLHDVADFLSAYPPFDAMPAAAVHDLAASARIEYFAAGQEIFPQSAEPRASFYVVRSGTVELADGDHVTDLLGAGELFGHRSMLAELPTSLAARAHEDALCYRLSGDVARPLLARPDGLRFVARAMVRRGGWPDDDGAPGPAALDLSTTPVGTLLRTPALVCEPGATIREAAALMTAAGDGAIVVDLGATVGLLTDSDLREQVISGPRSADDPVRAVMTAPAFTVTPERRGGEVLLEMLDRGLRHVPVRDVRGRVLGVLRAGDLLAAQRRAPFHLREAIARARTLEELQAATAQLRPAVLALRDAGVDAEQIGAIIAITGDALQRRLLDHAQHELGPAPVPFDWIVSGSTARREPVLNSDIDCCLAWDHPDEDAAVREYFGRLAGYVLGGLRACGVRLDTHGAVPEDPLMGRSLERWRSLAALLAADPTHDKARIVIALILDSRSVGHSDESMLSPLARELAAHPDVLAVLRSAAAEHRPPTGFFRDAIVGPTGQRARVLDMKRDGLIPVFELARWAAALAGQPGGSTRERLRAARHGGVLSDDDGRTLEEAFDLLCELILSHQAEQIRAGAQPDDCVDPALLNRLTRSYLRDAFRAIDSVQRRIMRAARAGAL